MAWVRSPGPSWTLEPATRLPAVIETDIPARLDRLPWGRFHTLVVVALGITWILDGLEVTLAGAVSGALKESPRLHFSNADVGFASSAYLAGAVLGALVSAGSPTGSAASGCSSSRSRSISSPPPRPRCPGTWRASRCFVSSPARASAANTPRSIPPSRSWCRRAIAAGPTSSSTAASGSARRSEQPARSSCSIRRCCAPDVGWRCAFLIGAALGLVIFIMRLWIPESPRWLMTHGRVGEAERRSRQDRGRGFLASGHRFAPEPLPSIRLRTRRFTPLREVFRTLFLRPPAAHARGLVPDGGAGVFLQRDLFHLRAGAHRFLRHPPRSRRLVSPAVRRRQFPRAGPARTPVRHGRAPADDRRDLRACRACC